MLQLIYSILERLDRAQHGRVFRIVACALGLAAIGTACGLVLAGRGRFLPEAYQENVVSSTAIAVMVLVGIVWLQRTLTALGSLIPGILLSLLLVWANEPTWGRMVLGISVLAVVFILALQLMRALFSLPWNALAIARLVLDEAIRMRLALVFILAVLVLIPLIAATLDPDEELRYRVQTFLSYGTGVSYGLLALMTLFLSTATVAFEQRSKTIFQVVTKPISRFEYVLGKWIGVMGLNAILLAIVAGSVFWFTAYLRELPAKNQYDALAVEEQVLTARVGVKPTFPDMTEDIHRHVLEQIDASPELEPTTQTILTLGQQMMDETMTRMRTVPPAETKEFRFENVRPVSRTLRRVVSPGDVVELNDPVKTVYDIRVENEAGDIIYAPGRHYDIGGVGSDRNAAIRILSPRNPSVEEEMIQPNQTILVHYYPANAITLRFKINSGDNDPGVHFPITIGIPRLRYFEVREVALVQTQTMLIPAGAVAEDGSLTIDVVNANVEDRTVYPEAFTFPPDGLEVMYKVSSFEANFLRAMTVIWIKLGFLAMLGIAAATFAGFPVACLLAFGVFLAAQLGPFLVESLEYYRTKDLETKEIIWSKWIIAQIGTAVAFLLRGYGEIRPTQRLIEGRLIPWSELSSAFLLISVCWTGISLLIGWLTMRGRQLAIYSGHS